MSRRSPSDELLEQLEEAGVPKGVIAKTIAVAPSAVSALYAGIRQLKYDEAVKLLRLVPAAQSGLHLPVIGLAGAGQWLEAVEHAREHIWAPRQIMGDAKFAVEVVGQSMNLLLPEGSLAIVDPDETEVLVGKIYLLRNAEGEATIKRFRQDPARFEPVSDDPTFEPFLIGQFDFRVIGRVTGSMRRF